MEKYLYKPQELRRPRIEKMLENIFNTPLFILAAPIGYGKTTAVRRVLEDKENVDVFWISLRTQEDDEMLWSRILMTMQNSGNMSFAEQNTKFPYTRKEQMDFLRNISTGFGKTTVLVLDNYHQCSSKCLNSIIEELAYMGVQGLHIVIIGRTYPDLPCEEMMLKDNCILMGQKYLEFSREEEKQFFEINGCRLSEEESSLLYRYTAGWASAVYLSLLDYLRNGKIGNFKSVYHLIETSILNKMEDDEREVLIMLAPLESFTEEQAEFITGYNNGAYILRKAWKNNCFINYDVVHKEYCIQALLQAVLKDEFIKKGYSMEKFHQRCAIWYEMQGKNIDAVQYYMAAGMSESIFQILEREDCFRLYRKAQGIFTKFFSQAPLELKAEHIKIYIPYIFQYIMEENYKEARALIKEMQQYFSDSREYSDNIMGELYIIYSMLFYNDFREMLKQIKYAYKLFHGKQSEIFTISRLRKYEVPEVLLLYHYKAGKLHDNINNLKLYYEYLSKITGNEDNGFEMLVDSEYAFAQGNMEKALCCAMKAYYKAKRLNHKEIVLSSLCVCLRVCLYQGKEDKFKDFASKMEIEKQRLSISDYEQVCSYIYICMGMQDKACGWIQDLYMTPEKSMTGIVKSGSIPYGYFLMRKKKYSELETLAEKIQQADSYNIYIYMQIYANMFLAVALYNLNEEKAPALACLSRAVELIRADGLKMIMVECSPEVIPILEKMEKDSFILELLENCYEYDKGRRKIFACHFGGQKEKEQLGLTQRETEVMELVRDGYKNVEISKQLHVALVTVEKTLSHIYQKLGVNNRTAAVTKLREEHLL